MHASFGHAHEFFNKCAHAFFAQVKTPCSYDFNINEYMCDFNINLFFKMRFKMFQSFYEFSSNFSEFWRGVGFSLYFTFNR